jgi:hypothetical protein
MEGHYNGHPFRAVFLAANVRTALEGCTYVRAWRAVNDRFLLCWVESMTRLSQTPVFWRFLREKEKTQIKVEAACGRGRGQETQGLKVRTK